MSTKEAIESLQEANQINAAGHALLTALDKHSDCGKYAYEDTNGLAALPDNFKLHDLERNLPNRRRPRGNMETTGIKSFAYYIHLHAEYGTAIFVDPARMQATAVLNLGSPTHPGHADNLATLNANKTAAFNSLQAITSGQAKQADVAEWLEDWQHLISCFHKEEKMPTIAAVQSIRNLTIDTARKLQSTVEQLGSNHSSFESVKASSTAGAVPDLIYFTCEPYAGLSQRLFVLRLSVTTGDSKPMLTLRVIKMEQHTEEMAQELADKITQVIALPIVKAQTAAGTTSTDEDGPDILAALDPAPQHIPVLIGTYRPAA